MHRADLRVIASAHTGLPYAQDYLINNRRHLIINNGSGGVANFRDTTYGVITRLSGQPEQPTDALYGTNLGPLRCDALPIRFDLNQWMTRFLDQWPSGVNGS